METIIAIAVVIIALLSVVMLVRDIMYVEERVGFWYCFKCLLLFIFVIGVFMFIFFQIH